MTLRVHPSLRSTPFLAAVAPRAFEYDGDVADLTVAAARGAHPDSGFAVCAVSRDVATEAALVVQRYRARLEAALAAARDAHGPRCAGVLLLYVGSAGAAASLAGSADGGAAGGSGDVPPARPTRSATHGTTAAAVLPEETLTYVNGLAFAQGYRLLLVATAAEAATALETVTATHTGGSLAALERRRETDARAVLIDAIVAAGDRVARPDAARIADAAATPADVLRASATQLAEMAGAGPTAMGPRRAAQLFRAFRADFPTTRRRLNEHFREAAAAAAAAAAVGAAPARACAATAAALPAADAAGFHTEDTTSAAAATGHAATGGALSAALRDLESAEDADAAAPTQLNFHLPGLGPA